MAGVLVLRIPFVKTFVFYVPDRYELFNELIRYLRRRFRPKIFAEIESGNDEVAIQLATAQGLASWRDEDGDSALIAAIRAGRSELVCKLIEIGGTELDEGALVAATFTGNIQIVNALLRAGKKTDDINPRDEFHQGWTALMWATNRHYFEIMKALLSAGADVNAVAKDGSTAAMCTRASTPNDLAALEVLCHYKPNITIKDFRGRDLVREAVDRERFSGMPEMRLLLERYYPEVVFDITNWK